MGLSNATHWVKTRKKLLRQVKFQVRALLGPSSGEILTYTRRYKAQFRLPWSAARRTELLRRLARVDIVLGGDFHAFSQSQRGHLRLLRELQVQRPIVLALECIESKDQDVLDQFMKDKISEPDFLIQVSWSESWGFPWQNYKPILEFAKERGLKVLALNKALSKRKAKTLELRDQHAAEKIVEAKQKFPEALIYAIYGDLHLAKGHLPKKIQKLDPKLAVLSLFQNVDELYFKNLVSGKLRSEIWQRGPDQYCLMESPPWVKWQSYLLFLEQGFDQDWQEQEAELDLTDYVYHMLDFFKNEFDLEFDLKDLAVYTSRQQAFVQMLDRRFPEKEKRRLDGLMERDRSFIVPEIAAVYLSRPSINHAAFLAGQYIHLKLSGRKQSMLQMPQYFLAWIWIEAVGFFFSKVINPHRKASGLSELKTLLAHAKPKESEALKLCLKQKLKEQIFLQTGRLNRKTETARFQESYFDAAKILGAMLGEDLYLRYRAGRLVDQQLKEFLQLDPSGENFSDQYWALLRQVLGGKR